MPTYEESLAHVFGRLNYEYAGMPRLRSELRIGRMRRLLRALGDPQDALQIVHVAGTKGKGSTAAMLAAAISAAGVPTGLFCSPHLHRLEERFRLNGDEPTMAEVIRLVAAVRPIAEALERTDPHLKSRPLTFFEFTTAMGLLHFAERGARVVLLEVGMGGRLDSTNAIRPVLSIITSISFDHTKQLGTTLRAIAAEKAGIIKRRGSVVSGVNSEAAADMIRSIAALRHAQIYEVGRDFFFIYRPPSPPVLRPDGGTVNVLTWAADWRSIKLPLLGPHQAANAAVAMAAIDALNGQNLGWNVSMNDIARGFSELRWPARVEVMGERPWMVVDGAHNVASAEALAETLETCLPECSRTLVFGTTRDKDLRGQLQMLLPLFDRVIATCYRENPRAVPSDQIVAEVARQSKLDAKDVPGPAEAIALARRLTPADGLICVTGSLFLAAEARASILAERKQKGDGAN